MKHAELSGTNPTWARAAIPTTPVSCDQNLWFRFAKLRDRFMQSQKL
jgi:hypothetical protein